MTHSWNKSSSLLIMSAYSLHLFQFSSACSAAREIAGVLWEGNLEEIGDGRERQGSFTWMALGEEGWDVMSNEMEI